MYLEFEKWHGCKNDFIVLQLSTVESSEVITSLRKQAMQLCTRDGSGISADGILVLVGESRTSLQPQKLVIINQDGSIAKNCGNGIRCAAGYINKKIQESANPYDDIETIQLEVEGVEIICRYLGNNRKNPHIAVEMGVPVLNEKNVWHQEVVQKAKEFSQHLTVDETHTCSIGNPHLVLFGHKFDRAKMLTIGEKMQDLKSLDGINVHLATLVQPESNDQKIAGEIIQGKISEIYVTSTWERGVGETQACGSGACSVAAAVFQAGFVDRKSWIAVDMPGGRLYVQHKNANDPITLAGPAQYVYSGKFFI